MNQSIFQISIVVDDYDKAIEFYTQKLGFDLLEDSVRNPEKRWVRVKPKGENGISLLLAKAKNEEEKSRIGNQTGGRVFLFIYTDDAQINTKGGPSTRRIIDFSDIENSISVLPTGQSGNPFSKHYNDQAEMYNTGKFRKLKLNKEEIIKTSTKLVFLPK